MKRGDWLTVALGLLLVITLFATLWSNESAAKVQVKQGGKIYGTYTLNQSRQIHIHGLRGETVISIQNGKARFARSPCPNQYCVHQGWLSKVGQVAVCLPNHISIELLGNRKTYDSLNY